MHVLLIEPDIVQAVAYRSALEAAGYSVSYARTAQGAVHVADERLPDVVVLEVQLPAHNGIEFLYEFRSYAEWVHVPVVVHSTMPPHMLTQSATLYKDLGVVRVLYKPQTSLEQLCRIVQGSVRVA